MGNNNNGSSKQSKNSEYKATDSRKYKLTLLIFAAATIMCLIPPLVSIFVFKLAVPGIVILSGTEWVSLMSILCGFYFGTNVWQKKIDGEVSITRDFHDKKFTNNKMNKNLNDNHEIVEQNPPVPPESNQLNK